MMEEHITVGKKFPQIRINTSYSFGIHDQDFTLAFETDDLMVFQDLIIQLRETRVSPLRGERYTDDSMCV